MRIFNWSLSVLAILLCTCTLTKADIMLCSDNQPNIDCCEIDNVPDIRCTDLKEGVQCKINNSKHLVCSTEKCKGCSTAIDLSSVIDTNNFDCCKSERLICYLSLERFENRVCLLIKEAWGNECDNDYCYCSYTLNGCCVSIKKNDFNDVINAIFSCGTSVNGMVGTSSTTQVSTSTSSTMNLPRATTTSTKATIQPPSVDNNATKYNSTSTSHYGATTVRSSSSSSAHLTSTAITLLTGQDTKSNVSSDNRKESDLIIGLVVALTVVLIILLILIIFIWRMRARRKALSSVPNKKLHLFTQRNEKNSPAIHDEKAIHGPGDISESNDRVYHQTDSTDVEVHPYWKIYDSSTDVLPHNSPNLYSTVSDEAQDGYDVQRAPSIVSPEPSDADSHANAYFVLEGESATQDYGSSGNYFEIKKENDTYNEESTRSSFNATVISPRGYSKLDEINRDSVNAYGVAEDIDNSVASLNLTQIPQKQTIYTLATIPSGNESVDFLAKNIMNNTKGDTLDMSESGGDYERHVSSQGNYFELENNYFETDPNSKDDIQKII